MQGRHEKRFLIRTINILQQLTRRFWKFGVLFINRIKRLYIIWSLNMLFPSSPCDVQLKECRESFWKVVHKHNESEIVKTLPWYWSVQKECNSGSENRKYNQCAEEGKEEVCLWSIAQSICILEGQVQFKPIESEEKVEHYSHGNQEVYIGIYFDFLKSL